MSNKIKNLTMSFVCIVIVLAASTALAKKNACGKEMSAEEMVERAPREDLAPYYTDKVFGESYSLTRVGNPLKSPRPPEPYCTFSDTFSYADEVNRPRQ